MNMSAFVVTMMVLLMLEIIGSLIWIVGTPPPRSKTVLAWTVAADIVVVLWGTVLVTTRCC